MSKKTVTGSTKRVLISSRITNIANINFSNYDLPFFTNFCKNLLETLKQ